MAWGLGRQGAEGWCGRGVSLSLTHWEAKRSESGCLVFLGQWHKETFRSSVPGLPVVGLTELQWPPPFYVLGLCLLRAVPQWASHAQAGSHGPCSIFCTETVMYGRCGQVAWWSYSHRYGSAGLVGSNTSGYSCMVP